jgi:hypothetical protein
VTREGYQKKETQMTSELLRKTMVPVLGVAAAVVALSLLTPRAVHAVVVTLVEVANTSANPVPVNTPTHLGVPVSSFVTLNCLHSGTTCSSFRQIDASGNQAATDYAIPAGKTLIVTDAEWEAVGGTAGRNSFLSYIARV